MNIQEFAEKLLMISTLFYVLLVVVSEMKSWEKIPKI